MRVFLNKGRSDKGKPILRPDLILEMGKNHIGDVELRRQISSDPVSAKDFPRGQVDRWGLGFKLPRKKDPICGQWVLCLGEGFSIRNSGLIHK